MTLGHYPLGVALTKSPISEDIEVHTSKQYNLGQVRQVNFLPFLSPVLNVVPLTKPDLKTLLTRSGDDSQGLLSTSEK